MTELALGISADSPRAARTIGQLLENVSASRLNLFHQCRLKFYFRYVRGLCKPKTAALYVGTIVHAVLQAWNLARWRRLPCDLETLRPVFQERWQSEQSSGRVSWKTQEETEQEAAWRLLEKYFQETPIGREEKPQAVEVSVEASLHERGLPTLIGIIDLVRTGSRIVDFKTSAQTPNTAKALHLNETQLAAYAVLYREATGTRETAIELHHLVKLKKPKIVVTEAGPMTTRQENRLYRIIESYVRGVEARDWVPNPNPMSCGGCEYFQECRAWN